MNRTIFKISVGFLAGALVLFAVALRLSDHYISEEQRLVAAGDNKGAMKSIKLAARLDPFSSEPLELQSFLLQSQNRNQEAEKAMEAAANRDPNNFVPYLLLGNLQMSRLDNLDAAAESYRKALKLNPHATVASNSLAQALLRANKFKQAARVYQKLEDNHQITILGLYNLGRIYVRTGKPKEGLKDITDARKKVMALQKKAKGSQQQQLESLSKSMQLAIADALVVEKRYGKAEQVLQYSNADQASAILQLLETNPAEYRHRVMHSAIY